MTIDEAKIKIGELACYARTKGWDDEYTEAVNMIIEALEQQPTDAVDRQAVIRIAEQGQVQGYEWQFKKLIMLPSVTPQQKMGRWIMSDDGLYRPICNNCGAHPWKGYIPTVEEATDVFKYCPNCGANMQEVNG